jgi:hypothetical protein
MWPAIRRGLSAFAFGLWHDEAVNDKTSTRTPFTVDRIIPGDDGNLYRLEITGEAELTRGPLGRIVDLCDQIAAEGLQVPPQILHVLADLQRPQEG